jgi:Mn2+/Fe2+ NRAMP family transporter
MLTALRQVGPGLILAAAIVGTGELIATTNLGAKAGFALLWLVVLSCFIKVFVQVELGRYAISSGQATFEAFRSLPAFGGALVWWCAGMLLVTQFQVGAMIGGVGQALHLVLPGVSGSIATALGTGDRPELVLGAAVAILTAFLLIYGGYRFIERFMTFMVAGFTLMTVLCLVFLPAEDRFSTGDVLSGFRFEIPAGLFAAALAMFGITGVGANELLVGPRDASPAWTTRALGWMKVLRLDAWVSMGIYTLATICFYLLGAAVLHSRTSGAGLPDTVDGMLSVLTRMYEPVLGPVLAKWFLMIGAVSVLYSTIYAATAGTSRLLADFLALNGYFPADDPDYRRRWVGLFGVALLGMSFVLFAAFGSPVKMVVIGGIAQAVTLPLIATAAVFLRYRRTDTRLRPGKTWDVFLWLSMLGLILSGVIGFSKTPPGQRLMAWLGIG